MLIRIKMILMKDNFFGRRKPVFFLFAGDKYFSRRKIPFFTVEKVFFGGEKIFFVCRDNPLRPEEKFKVLESNVLGRKCFMS